MHEIGIGGAWPAGAVHMGFGVIADSPEGIHSRTHQIHHGTGLFGGAAGLFSGLNCRSQFPVSR